MGLKGNLSTVNLADVFQVLSRGSSTGLLRIQAPEGPRFVEIQNGAISIAGRSAGRIMLGDLLLARGLVDDAALQKALELQKTSGKLLGQVLIENGLLTMQQLEEALRFQIEEEVCELFTLHRGDFDFLEGAGLDARIAPAGGLVRLKLELNELLMEAARRAEEWKVIEQRIPNQAFVFQLSAEGGKAVQSGEGLSPEGTIILRMAQAHRTVEAVVQKGCLGRFNTNRMLLELWDVGLIEPVPRREYLAVAREHLRLGRLDEAQRIAELAQEGSDAAQKEQARALLAEVAKARKPGSPAGTASVNVSADARVRSEIIRRAPANLMLKKQRSVWPLVVVAALVLAGIGGGLYYQFGRGAVGEYTISRKQLEETNTQAQDLIAAGKYAEGLQLLRDFRTLNSEVRKQANELFERKQKDVEAMLLQAIEHFSAAYKGDSAEEKKTAAEELLTLIDISVLTPHVEVKRARARLELDAYLDSQRAAQFEEKARELESGADQGAEARLQGYAGLLAEDPPDSVAVKVRGELHRLEAGRREAARLLQCARDLRDAGDGEAAKALYDKAKQVFPGSAAAADAAKELAAVNEKLAVAQAECERSESLLMQNKTAEARAALLKFLEGKPTYQLTLRALGHLHGLQQADEAELAAGLKAANALYDRQPPDAAGARARITELVEKQPFAKAARAATLRVEVTSQPEGATVTVNGKAGGVTPVRLDVPALGFVRMTFSKEGCRTAELVACDLREERLVALLDRLPASSSRAPIAARYGLAVEPEAVVLGGPSASPGRPAEVVVYSRQDTKAPRRIKLPKSGPVKDGEDDGAGSKPHVPPLAVFNGQAFLPLAENALLAVNLARGEIRRIALGTPATSSPIFYEVTDEAGGKSKVVGVATQGGYECYRVEDCTPHKRVPVGDGAKPAPWGAAFDGELIFLPRSDFAVHALSVQSGARKWGAGLDAELCGPPVLYPVAPPGRARQGGGALGVTAFDGRVAVFDAQSGKAIWRQDSGAPVAVGPASMGAGFLVLRRDCTAELLPLDRKGEALWTARLPGEPSLPALVLRDKASPQGKAAAICTQPAANAGGKPGAGGPALVVLAADSGTVLWRAALPAVAVALAAEGDSLYVSTEDAGLTVFDLK